MSYNKIASVVDSLIVNTQNGKLKWKESSLERDAFEYSFAHSTIVISEGRNEHGDCIHLAIYNEEGKLIESLSDDDLLHFFLKPYQELSALYHTARRQAMGVDDVLDEMLSELPSVPKDLSLIEKKKEKDLIPAFPNGLDDVPF